MIINHWLVSFALGNIVWSVVFVGPGFHGLNDFGTSGLYYLINSSARSSIWVWSSTSNRGQEL